MSFKALLLENDPAFFTRLAVLDEAQLPPGDVLVRVAYSTLNYKDALAITNKSPVVRAWPMVAGIDATGVVEHSTHPDIRPGEEVIINGWGQGETRWGGLSQRVRVPGEWLVKLPDAYAPLDAATIGTAGYTAALCVIALLQHGITPDHGPVLVTGATGGVGSIAVVLLARAGFQVTALTGKSERPYLEGLGAMEVLDRVDFAEPGRPLQKERYMGVVDTLGSHALANALAQVMRNGAVAACGLAMGMELPTSVAPFILRGVTLYGIDSVYAVPARRQAAWALLAQHISASDLAGIATLIGLEEVIPAAEKIIAGQMTGRYVVDVNR